MNTANEKKLKWHDVETGAVKYSLGRSLKPSEAIKKLNEALASGNYPEIKEGGKTVFLIEKDEIPIKHELKITENKGVRSAELKSKIES